MKRTIDEKESLQELLEHPALPLLVGELEALTRDLAADVLKYDIADAELIKRKCHLDGAHKLVAAFKQRLKTLKPRHDV